MKKRLMSLLLVVAMLAAMVVPLNGAQSPQAKAADILLGDLNEDGKVNTSDARCVLQVCVEKFGPDKDWGESSLLPSEKRLADVDQNDKISTTDARLILQYVAEKISGFPDPNAYDANSFGPTSQEAGSSFVTLSELPANEPAEVTDSTKAFGIFALTTENNPALPFNVACHVTDTAITALLPDGVDLSAVLVDYTYYGDKVLYNGAPIGADTAFDFTSPVKLTKVARDGSEQEVTVRIETLNTGLPSMAVTLENYAGVGSIQKEEYSSATFYLGGGDPDKCSYAPAESLLVSGSIKGRGNSSWLLDEKKSYTVKLDKKATLLDMSESKDWAIVGNYEDKSLMRNAVAETFAEAAGIPYVMRVRPVDMWIDGVYWGTYNLTEKIEIEKDRVNITDTKKPDNEEFTDPAANEVGYLLEFDAHVVEENAGGILENVQGFDPAVKWAEKGWPRWEYTYTDLYENREMVGVVYYNPETDETFFRVPYCRKWATIKNPSTENLEHNGEMREYIFQKVMELDSALRNRNNDPDKIEEVLDLKSFAQWAIVQELMDNTDSTFHSSVYMSLDVNGKFVFGPAWDFDRSSGNCDYWTYSVGNIIEGTDWGRYAFGTEAGRAALKEAWQEFKAATANWEQEFDATYEMILDSGKANFERWDILGTYVYYNSAETATIDTFKGQVNFLKEWLQNRYKELDNYITYR